MAERLYEVLLKGVGHGIAQQVQRDDDIKGPRVRLEAREMHAWKVDLLLNTVPVHVHARETQALLPALRKRSPLT